MTDNNKNSFDLDEFDTPIDEEGTETPAEGADDFSFDDLAEFAADGDMPAVTLDDEEIALTEDTSGFAKGFPKWALHPPKD